MRLSDLLQAAHDLDSGAVAGIVCTLTAEHGVAETWSGACVPALHRAAGAHDPLGIAVQRSLVEGIARGLDLAGARHHPRTDDMHARTGDVQVRTGSTYARTGEVHTRTGDTHAATGEAHAGTGDTHARTGDTHARTGDTHARTGDTHARTGDTHARAGDVQARTGDTCARTGDVQARTGDTCARTGDVHARTGGARVLLACAPGEAHELPLRALAAALDERRIVTVPLGARVPWPALHAAVGRAAPETAVVWAQTAATADAAGVLAVAGAHPATAFAVAGPGWAQAGVASALTIAGLDHLTSLDLAVSACAGALSH